MFTLKSKTLSAFALTLVAALVAGGTLLLAPFAPRDAAAGRSARPPAPRDEPAGRGVKAKPRPSCVVLWLSGGPSQIDTFDPKPGHVNGQLVGAIDTTIKGVQLSAGLPELSKLTNHLTIIRSLSHREGDHARGTYLMQTGRAKDGLTEYPALGSVLAKELGDGRPGLPRYFRILPGTTPTPPGPGFLGARYAPLVVGAGLALPPADEFEEVAKGQGEQMRKAVAKAFDLSEEKAAVRDAYGRGTFGRGCLLARRLVEAEVPVVEVTLAGWDMHANAGGVLRLGWELDAALSALLRDLHERKRLETTLVVVMGEFGRTPRINAAGGRDHYPMCGSVVLAGATVKGGQVIGKTSDDGVKVENRPVTPQELLATIYEALGVDPAKKMKMPGGKEVPLVEKGTTAVKEALR